MIPVVIFFAQILHLITSGRKNPLRSLRHKATYCQGCSKASLPIYWLCHFVYRPALHPAKSAPGLCAGLWFSSGATKGWKGGLRKSLDNSARPIPPGPQKYTSTCLPAIGLGLASITPRYSGSNIYFLGLDLLVHVRQGVGGVALYKLLNRISSRGFFFLNGKLFFHSGRI